MKLLNIKTLVAAALISTFAFGNAFAMNSQVMPLTSISGVTSSNLRVHIEDGVAHLFGNVRSDVESAIAEAYVKNLDGVTEVTNNIFN